MGWFSKKEPVQSSSNDEGLDIFDFDADGNPIISHQERLEQLAVSDELFTYEQYAEACVYTVKEERSPRLQYKIAEYSQSEKSRKFTEKIQECDRQARDDIRYRVLTEKLVLSPDDYEFLVQRRRNELVEPHQDEYLYGDRRRSATQQSQQQQVNISEKLDILTETVERGNYLAKIEDFVHEHPFLAGMLSRQIYNKISGK